MEEEKLRKIIREEVESAIRRHVRSLKPLPTQPYSETHPFKKLPGSAPLHPRYTPDIICSDGDV